MATTQSPRTPRPTDERSRARRRVRRTAAAGAVAAACAVAIAAPFVLRAGHDPAPSRSGPVSQPPQVPHGALTGDVDGDGRPDTVSLSFRGLLRITFGSGTKFRHFFPYATRLEGLVGTGDPALDIAVSERHSDGSNGRDWTIWRLAGSRLNLIPIHRREVIGTQPGSSTAWVDGHRLYDGSLDELQRDQDQVAVVARRWVVRAGQLAPTHAGTRCWDRASGGIPTACAPGQDWTYDVGPHGALPDLDPIGAYWFKAAKGPVVDGPDSWTLARATPPGPDDHPWTDLVLRSDGGTAHVLLPQDFPPVLRGQPVYPGQAHGVLISQEGGDAAAWLVYVDDHGQPVQLPTDGHVALGGGFTGTGETEYLSWVADDGRIFTRVGTGRASRYRVYAWDPVDLPSSSVPTLQARDLGIVCVDDLLGTYGTCAD